MRFCSLGLVFFLFIGLIIGGIVLLLAVPLYIFPPILKSQLYIRQHSDGSYPIATEFWAKLPVLEHFRFYMFNITNPHEVLKGAEVILQEKGPYTYIETEFKQDIVFEDDGNTVRYKNNKTWTFSPENSCPTCKEADRFFQVNVVYTYVASFVYRHVNKEFLHLLDVFMLFIGSHALSHRTVKDYLFGSYHDPLIDIYHNKIFQVIHDALGAPLPIPAIPNMGYLPKYNWTSDGDMVTKTGKRNSDETGSMVSWNNLTELPWWNDTESRSLAGSGEGAFSRPMLTKNDIVKTFQPLTSRVWRLVYMNKTERFKGIETYWYGMHKDEYNTKVHKGYRYDNPEKQDYFPYLNRTGEEKYEIPVGMVPLRALPALFVPLYFPAFFSAPHFYGASREVIDNPDVKGIRPNESLHQSAIFKIEPKSGASMHVIFRIQANFALSKNPIFHELNHVRNTIFPSFWLEVEAYVQDNCLNFIRFSVSILPALLFWAGIGCSFLGVFGTMFTVYCCWKRKKHPQQKWCLYEAK